jgi:hypothetical protein
MGYYRRSGDTERDFLIRTTPKDASSSVLSEEKRPVPTVAYLPDSENDWIIQIR